MTRLSVNKHNWMNTMKTYTLEVEYDTDLLDPRAEYDHLFTLYLRRFNGYRELSDKHADRYYQSDIAFVVSVDGYPEGGLYADEQIKPDEIERAMYDHAGIMYITREQIKNEYGWTNITKKRARLLLDCARSELSAYSAYLQGEVYGYTITDDETGEIADSCWGFYGYEYCMQEARAALEYIEREDQARAWSQVDATIEY